MKSKKVIISELDTDNSEYLFVITLSKEIITEIKKLKSFYDNSKEIVFINTPWLVMNYQSLDIALYSIKNPKIETPYSYLLLDNFKKVELYNNKEIENCTHYFLKQNDTIDNLKFSKSIAPKIIFEKDTIHFEIWDCFSDSIEFHKILEYLNN